MQDVGYAALQVIPSFSGFEGKLERGTRGPLSTAGRKGGTVFGDSAGRSMVASISSHAKHAAFLAAGAFSAAAAGGIVLLRGSFAQARESQKVAALTTSTIKATGGAANVTAKDIDRLSNAIGKKAAIDDETVASGLNMLLTFKNVRNEVGKGNKIFDHAGQTIADMAAAMAASSGGDVDLKSASIQVGKALNDPIKGISALGRVGVTFTQGQKDQIAALVATGDTMGAQKIILRELTSEFGGAAKSQATGADKVAFAWGNVKEKLGTALLPLMQDFTHFLLTDALPAVDGYVDVFQKKGVPALKHFFDKAKPIAEDMLPKLGSILGTVKDDLSAAAPYAKDLVDAFVNMPDWAQKAIVGGGLAAVAGSKLGIGSVLTGGKSGGAAGGLLGLVSKAKPLPVFVVNNGLGGELPGAGGKLGGKSLGPVKTGLAAFLPILPAAGAIGADHNNNLDEHGRPIGKHPLTAAELQGVVRNANGEQGLGDASRDLKGLLFPTLGPGMKPKIEAKFSILGMIEADAAVQKFRDKAGRPIHVKVVPEVAALNAAIGNLFGDAFGDPSGAGDLLSGPLTQRRGGSGQRVGGITVHGGMHVQAHDYRDLQRQLQNRMQQQSIGGIGAMS